VVVDVGDILGAELVAIIVDFVLDVERPGRVEVLTIARHERIHLAQGIVNKLEHLHDMVVLRFGEILLAAVATVDGAREVVA